MSAHTSFALALSLLAATSLDAVADDATAAHHAPPRRLLTQRFDPRAVTQIEIGDFHFAPGQVAPVHTHAAPAFGYVSRGAIFYQIEGERPQVLKAGDVFYEPTGINILHFDNASKTEEAVFTDLNFERDGEPFIVFPTPPTAKIDRRGFPSETLRGAPVNTVEIDERALPPSASLALADGGEAAVVYVAQGSLSVTVRGEAPIIYLAGQTCYLPKDAPGTRVLNPSRTGAAKLITFHLRG